MRFTVQLTAMADGRKLPPLIIFKAAGYHWMPSWQRPQEKGKKTRKGAAGKGTVWYEIVHRLPDAQGNEYPARGAVHIITSLSATSDVHCTSYFLASIWKFRRGGGVQPPSVLVWDAFTAHGTAAAHQLAAACNTSTQVIDGGLTPVLQPMDRIVNRVSTSELLSCGIAKSYRVGVLFQVFKLFMREQYDSYALTAAVNDRNAMIAPSRQLVARWVVAAWERIPSNLIVKAFLSAGITSPEMYGDVDTGLCPQALEEAYRCSNAATLLQGADDAAGLEDAVDLRDDAEYFNWAQVEHALASQGQQVSTRPLEVGCSLVFRWPSGWCFGTIVGSSDCEQQTAENDDTQEDDADVSLPWDVEYEDGVWPQLLSEQDRQHTEFEHAPIGAWVSVEYR